MNMEPILHLSRGCTFVVGAQLKLTSRPCASEGALVRFVLDQEEERAEATEPGELFAVQTNVEERWRDRVCRSGVLEDNLQLRAFPPAGSALTGAVRFLKI